MVIIVALANRIHFLEGMESKNTYLSACTQLDNQHHHSPQAPYFIMAKDKQPTQEKNPKEVAAGRAGGVAKAANQKKVSEPSLVSAKRKNATSLMDPRAPHLPLLPNMLPKRTDSTAPARAESTVTELKPWQVHFLSGGRQMEKMRLEPWLLADKMGLEKTLRCQNHSSVTDLSILWAAFAILCLASVLVMSQLW